MTQWEELERELRLAVHPTFADKLLDNALESDNMLGAYGEIADLVATLRSPATLGELSSQSDAVSEMSKLLRSGHGSSATGVVVAGKKAMAVAAAAASLATASAFAAGLPAALQELAATVSGALVGLVDGGDSGRTVADPSAAATEALRGPEEQAPSEQPPPPAVNETAPAPEVKVPPVVDEGEPVLVGFSQPHAAAPDSPPSEPRTREAALPVGAAPPRSGPDEEDPEVPAAGTGDEPVPPTGEDPPPTGSQTPPTGPPPGGGGGDSRAAAPFVPPLPSDDDGDHGEDAPPEEDNGNDDGNEGDDGGQGDDDQGGDGDDQGGDDDGQGDDGDDQGGDDGQGDEGGQGDGGDDGSGDDGQGDEDAVEECQSDGGNGNENGNGNGNENGNGNGNANGHCKQEDGPDDNNGGGNG